MDDGGMVSRWVLEFAGSSMADGRTTAEFARLSKAWMVAMRGSEAEQKGHKLCSVKIPLRLTERLCRGSGTLETIA